MNDEQRKARKAVTDRARYLRNREAKKKDSRDRYAADPVAHNKRVTRWRQENPEKRREIWRTYKKIKWFLEIKEKRMAS
ncbi:MAG: hypothetical protein ACO22A_05560 [Schleiferiaceae bacterium]